VRAQIGLTALAANWVKRAPPRMIEGLIGRTRLDLGPSVTPAIEDREAPAFRAAGVECGIDRVRWRKFGQSGGNVL
jgi:hypothetical protein